MTSLSKYYQPIRTWWGSVDFMMNLVRAFRGFCDALGTPGGSLFLLTIILFALYPLLVKNDSEGWKAVMFVLGAITGLINSKRGAPESPIMRDRDPVNRRVETQTHVLTEEKPVATPPVIVKKKG